MNLKGKKIATITFFLLFIAFFISASVLCFVCGTKDKVQWGEPIHLSVAIGIMLYALSVFSLLISHYIFSPYTCYFPLNDINDYMVDISKESIGEIFEDKLIIKIQQIEKGVYQTLNSNKILKFDLKGYLFPKSYLISYFVRNFNYRQVNKDKLKLFAILDNLKLTYLKDYVNVELIIDNRTYKVVKNKKTKQTVLSWFITYSPFYTIITWRSNDFDARLKEYCKINEQKYYNYKLRLCHKNKKNDDKNNL